MCQLGVQKRPVRSNQFRRSRFSSSHVSGLSSNRHSNAAGSVALEECDQHGRARIDLLLTQPGQSGRRATDWSNDAGNVSVANAAGPGAGQLCICQRLPHASIRISQLVACVRSSRHLPTTAGRHVPFVQIDGHTDQHVLADRQIGASLSWTTERKRKKSSFLGVDNKARKRKKQIVVISVSFAFALNFNAI